MLEASRGRKWGTQKGLEVRNATAAVEWGKWLPVALIFPHGGWDKGTLIHAGFQTLAFGAPTQEFCVIYFTI